MRTLIPSWRPPSWPNYLPKFSSPNTITLGFTIWLLRSHKHSVHSKWALIIFSRVHSNGQSLLRSLDIRDTHLLPSVVEELHFPMLFSLCFSLSFLAPPCFPSLLCIFSFHLCLLSPFDPLLELVRDGCAGLKSIPEVARNLQKTCWSLESLGVKCSIKRAKYPGWNGRRML